MGICWGDCGVYMYPHPSQLSFRKKKEGKIILSLTVVAWVQILALPPIKAITLGEIIYHLVRPRFHFL